jgi:UDP-GlcNAc:undecaprenyl-phosphate GlcNAc-1-phosphate transferase
MGLVYSTAFFLSLALTLALTPFAIFLSRQFNVYDMPSRRKVHTRPIPRWGGIGIFLSCALAVAAVILIFPSLKTGLFSYELISSKSKFIGSVSIKTQLIGILIGSIFIVALGMRDDKKPVQAVTKLLIMIIAAYCTMDFGVRILGVSLPFGIRVNFLRNEFMVLLSQFITVLWLIGFMNTINLADGLDGLAAGIVTIASATFFVVSILMKPDNPDLAHQMQLSALLSVVVAGACLGFLFYNFNPAKVFLGDSGALFLGFMLASISIIGTLKTPLFISLLVPVLIVGLPVLDVLLSILRRLGKGQRIMDADKDHIHHRLLKWGWTQKEVVLLMYVITLVLSVITITLTALKLGARI